MTGQWVAGVAGLVLSAATATMVLADTPNAPRLDPRAVLERSEATV